MTDIDLQKNVYVFLHGRMDLRQKAAVALTSRGFSKERIMTASPAEVGGVGDYMAMLWMPPNPDHIKVKRITGVKPVKPEGMIGLWRGVSSDDLFTIPL